MSLHVVCLPPPKLKILAMPMAQHARIRYCRKRQQFFGPPERNFAPLEQRSSCGTEEAMMHLTALLPPTWAKSQNLTLKCKILNVLFILIVSIQSAAYPYRCT